MANAITAANIAFPKKAISALDFAAVATVYFISFVIVFGFPHGLPGFPFDDSWIHQDIARNLARFGTIGFVPGRWTSGTTSYLWTFVLAVNWRLFPFISPVVFSASLNCGLLMAVGLCMLAIARADGFSRSEAWMLAIAPALDGNFIWLGVIGMEHVLFVALSLMTILFAFRSGPKSRAICSICYGALILTRPEGLCLGVILAPALLIPRGRRPHPRLLELSIPACFLFLELLLNRATSRSWLPVTYAGRRWLFFGAEHISNTARFLFTIKTTALLSNLTPSIPPTDGRMHLVVLVLLFAGPVIAAVSVARLVKDQRWRTMVLISWCTVLFFANLIMLPSSANGNRYQSMVLLLRLPMLLVFLYFIGRKLQLPAQLRSTAVVVLALALGLHSILFWRNIARDGVEVVEASHGAMGSYLEGNFPNKPAVAAFDFGRIAFVYSGRVRDLGGLTDASYLGYLRESNVIGYLEAQNMPYFVWPSKADGSSDIPKILTIEPALRSRLDSVAKFCAPYEAWNASQIATNNHSQCQILYRLK